MGVFNLQIASPKSALIVAKQMMPFCFKKYEELKVMADYYQDRITGTEAIRRINEAVNQGVRLGEIRGLRDMPKYGEGKHRIARARGMRAAEARWNARRALAQRLITEAETRRT